MGSKKRQSLTRIALAIVSVLIPAASAAELSYDVLFDVRVVPTERAAQVEVQIGTGAEYLKEVNWRIDPARHFDFTGDGEVEVEEDRVRWVPPPTGGSLRYTFLIDHLRGDRAYDARCTKTWALFRGDDLVPAARTRVTLGAKSRSRLRLRVPEGWTRATPYPLISGGDYQVSHPGRGFDRPTGWIVAGHLGSVREEVGGIQIAVAGPVQHQFRRLDILALLRWTMPTLVEIVGELPPRLLVVGAGDPMWRGGLSGPRSVYVHARRPLIAEDGTSPLLHEVIHAMLGIHATSGDDWIVEGIAEFYSLELLRRSSTLSADRMGGIFGRIKKRGRTVKTLKADRASGARVAKAVDVFRDLDSQIRSRTEGERSLDDVVRLLAKERGEVDVERLKTLTTEATGLDLSPFFQRRL